MPAETDYVHHLSDHLPKDVRNFAAEGGHSLLWPEATTFLNHRGAYDYLNNDASSKRSFPCSKKYDMREGYSLYIHSIVFMSKYCHTI